MPTPCGVRPVLPATAIAPKKLAAATSTHPAIASAGMRRRSANCTHIQPVIAPPTRPPRWPPIEIPLTVSENTTLISSVAPRPLCQIEMPR